MQKRFRLWFLPILLLSILFGVFSLGSPPRTEARDLVDVLGDGVSGFGLTFGTDVTSVAPAISGAVGQAVTQQFPLTSVAPAFTYRLDPTLNIFTPQSSVSGPLFSERALTLGRGLHFSQKRGDRLAISL